MPVYNAKETLPWALASLMAQTYDDWECVLVDDGSTDRSIDLVEELGEPRIRYLRLEKNVGRGATRNIALGLSRGKYLAFLDADDWYYPTKLEQQVSTLETDARLALVSCRMAVVDSSNRLVGIRGKSASDNGSNIGQGDGRPVAQRVCFPTSMTRLELAKTVRFRDELRHAEDWDFLIRLLAGRRYRISSDVWYAYRSEPGVSANMSTQNYLDYFNGCRKILQSYQRKYRILTSTMTLRLWTGRFMRAARSHWFPGGSGNTDPLPTNHETKGFEAALNKNLSVLNELFAQANTAL